MTKEELVENFSYLSDWEDKYRYLIELGEQMPDMEDNLKNTSNKVEGCMSQVWIYHEIKNDKHIFLFDSDAHIVKGLEAILHNLVNNKTSDEIKALNIPDIFHELGLEEHLSPTRRNGFASMIKRIYDEVEI